VYVGCNDNFLDVDPKEAPALDSYFASESDAVSAINATYASLQQAGGLYSQWYPKAVEGASDDMSMDNTGDLELTNYTWNASLWPTDYSWQALYEGVFRANLVLKNVPDIEMDQSLKDRILGEARFLRALNYWHLMTLFGSVPLVTEEHANPNDPSQAAIGKSPPADIIELMVDDLQMAADLLPASYSSQNVGRATEGAAKALLGKVHLYSASPIFGGNQQGYSLAAEQFESVINDYNYQLVDYQDLWVEDNTAESIFEVQYEDFGGSIWSGADAAGANETNLRAALNYPVGHGGNGNLIPTQELVDEYEDYSGPDSQGRFDGRDPRLYYTVWKQGDDFDDIDPTYQSGWSPTGYNLKKGLAFPFTDRSEDGTTRNIPVLRLGGVLLMYAEALNAKSNREPAAAIDAINRVRSRVNMPTYPNSGLEYNIDASSSEQEIFEAIVHERRVELAGEYQRYNDLRRWELAEQEMGDIGWEHPRHTFFPIPTEELDNNPNLSQNPEYQ
jgi:hypothetical protein